MILSLAASAVLIWLGVSGRIPNSWQECVGAVAGAWCVWLAAKENIWNWPIGLVNAVFTGIVLFEGKLFADAWLQLVYFLCGIWGWWSWVYGGANRTELPVTRCSRTELLIGLALGAIGTYFARLLLIRYNGASPMLDAVLTSFSLVAQYWLIRKRIENWVLWIVLDVVYVPWFAYRQYYLFAILYFVFLVLAVIGYRDWKNSLEKPAIASTL